MLEATLAHLTERQFIRDERIDWPRIVDGVCTLLLERIVDSEDEIDGKALTVPEIREAVLGDASDDEVNAELNQKITSTLGIADKGRVQKALENGHVLCSARIRRPGGEGEAPVSTSVRFVSGDPDVIEQFNNAVLLQRAVNATTTANRAIEMGAKRIPLLAARRPTLLTRAQAQLALAMPLAEDRP